MYRNIVTILNLVGVPKKIKNMTHCIFNIHSFAELKGCLWCNLKISEERSQCQKSRSKFSVCFGFNKIYGLADTPAIFHEKTDRALQYCTPARLVFGTPRRLTNNWHRFSERCTIQQNFTSTFGRY